MSTKKQAVKKQKNPVQLAQYRVTVKDRDGAEVVYDFDTLALHGGRQGEDSVIVQVFGRPEDVAELAESAKESMIVIRRHAMEHMIASKRQDRSNVKAKPAPRRKLPAKKVAPKTVKK